MLSRHGDDAKTCPVCGEPMRVVRRAVVDHVPGMKQSIERVEREWICSNCDHYEDVEEGEGTAG